MIEYLRGDRLIPACPPSAQAPVHAPTSVSNDEVIRDLTLLKLPNSYPVWPGRDDVRHDFFDFNQPAAGPAGEDVYLMPTITTFYGHRLVTPFGISITPFPAAMKVRMVLLTLHRADGDAEKELTVAAWQGDNDTFHLIAPLPDEDEILGPVRRTVFGKLPDDESRAWRLGTLYYGDSAVLDIDISKAYTPGKALRA